MKKTLFGAALAGALLVGLLSPAGARGLPALVVAPSSVQPGQSFTVSGSQCFSRSGGAVAANGQPPGPPATGPQVDVTVGFTPPLMQSTNADFESGEWSVTFTVPANTPPGTYPVNATCQNVSETGLDVGAAQVVYPPGSVTVSAVPQTAPPAPAPTPAPAEPSPPAPAVAGTPRTAG